MPGETEPVAAARQLPDVADRPAADQPGQLEDLGRRENWTLARVFAARPADPARITGEDLVIFDRRRQDRAKQPVGLLAFMLSHVRGFSIFQRNYNGETDEIDIVVRVDAFSDACWSESGVPFVLVEAKNWRETVGSHVVTVLIRKLGTRRGRARIGILFATSSFSDEAKAEELKEAKGKLCVVMVGPEEIAQRIESDDPTEFLDRCVIKAILR